MGDESRIVSRQLEHVWTMRRRRFEDCSTVGSSSSDSGWGTRSVRESMHLSTSNETSAEKPSKQSATCDTSFVPDRDAVRRFLPRVPCFAKPSLSVQSSSESEDPSSWVAVLHHTNSCTRIQRVKTFVMHSHTRISKTNQFKHNDQRM